MNMVFKYSIQPIDYQEFYSFLKDVEQDFVPPLLERINAEDFHTKLTSFGKFVQCRFEDSLVGLITFYANNKETKIGFVPFIAVKKEFRGNNIAGQLLSIAADESKNAGMSVFAIDTNNEIAKQCYRKNGFVVTKTHPVEEYNLTRYYLEKTL